MKFRRTLGPLASLFLIASALSACGGSAPAHPAAKAATTANAAAQPAASTAASSAASSAGTSSAASSSSAPKTLKKVTLLLPWLVGGYDDGFILADAKGYYKAAGFDVTIEQGKGSKTTTQQVGNGIATFGLADAGTVATLVSKGEPVKVIGDYVQGSPMSFVYDKRYPFSSPKDLLGGRQVFSSAGDADLTIVPAVLAKFGMTKSQLHLTLIQPSSYASILARYPKAVVLAYADSDYLRIKVADPSAVYKRYADFGVNLYNIGMVTTNAELKQHPGEVRRFLAATTKGWEYTDQHPAEAVADDHAMFPNAKPSVELAGLKMAIQWQHTQATQGHTIGWMAQSDWKQTVDLLHKYAGLNKVLPIADYYTNAYLPGS